MLCSIVDSIRNNYSKVMPTYDWLTNRCLSLYLFRIHKTERSIYETEKVKEELDEKLQPIDNTYFYVACSNIEYVKEFFSYIYIESFHITPADVSYSKDCIVFDQFLLDFLAEQELKYVNKFTCMFEPFCFVDSEDKQNIYHKEFGFRMVHSPSDAYMSRRNLSPYQLYLKKKPFLYVLLPSNKIDKFERYDNRIKWKQVSCCESIEFCLVNGRYLTFQPNNIRYILADKLSFFPKLNEKLEALEKIEHQEWKQREKERRKRENKDYEFEDDNEGKEEEEEEEENDEKVNDMFQHEFHEEDNYTWFHMFLEMYANSNDF